MVPREAQADLGAAQGVAAQQGQSEERVEGAAREQGAECAEQCAGKGRTPVLGQLHPAGVSASQEGGGGEAAIQPERERDQEDDHGGGEQIHQRKRHPAAELCSEESGQSTAGGVSESAGQVIGGRETEALIGVRLPGAEGAGQRGAHGSAVGRYGQSRQKGAGAGLNEREHGRSEG